MTSECVAYDLLHRISHGNRIASIPIQFGGPNAGELIIDFCPSLRLLSEDVLAMKGFLDIVAGAVGRQRLDEEEIEIVNVEKE